MRPVLKVFKDDRRAERGLPAHSFTIDGQESLYWSTSRPGIERVTLRLQQGRSTEAFGGNGVVTAGALSVGTRTADSPKGRGKVVSYGEVTTETVKTKSGRAKPREKRPGFVFELDGIAYEDKVTPFEADARALCAIEAFRTRGKLNPARHKEIQEQFRDQFKRDCKVHLVGRSVVVKDAEGLLWGVAHSPGTGYQFKQLGT